MSLWWLGPSLGLRGLGYRWDREAPGRAGRDFLTPSYQPRQCSLRKPKRGVNDARRLAQSGD